MKKPFRVSAFAAAILVVTPTFSAAGPIEGACLHSGRDAASRALCGCIQEVADMTLKGADQRRAAKFFRDPELAHEVWISQRPSDDAFWDRYRQFGELAEAYCAF